MPSLAYRTQRVFHTTINIDMYENSSFLSNLAFSLVYYICSNMQRVMT